MTDEAWVEAMELSSKNQRLKYYLHLQKRVHTKKAFLLKRAALKEEMKSNLKNEDYEHGRIFMRIYEQTMRRWVHLLSTATRFKSGIITVRLSLAQTNLGQVNYQNVCAYILVLCQAFAGSNGFWRISWKNNKEASAMHYHRLD